MGLFDKWSQCIGDFGRILNGEDAKYIRKTNSNLRSTGLTEKDLKEINRLKNKHNSDWDDTDDDECVDSSVEDAIAAAAVGSYIRNNC